MAYSEDDVNELYDLADGTCFYCEKRLSFQNYGAVGEVGAWEVDHFIPLAAGGTDEPRNRVPACVDCNTRKSDLMPWEFDPDRFAEGDENPDNYI